MYSQERLTSNTYQLDAKLEQILKDSKDEIKERTHLILLEIEANTETAIKDVRQHINEFANN